MKDESSQYPSGTGHKYQILLNSSSTLTALDDANDIPEIPFSFVGLDNIKELGDGVKIGTCID